LQPVALAPLVAETLPLLGPLRDRRTVSLRTGRLDLQVLADPTRLRQVLLNLLSNAIKYNRPGGWVRLRAKAAGDLVELSVADSGPGLSEAERARLFTPFERLGAKHGPVAGTGLGLALSRQLAEAMGGSIEVESEPGQGATFRVRLPAG
jgi:signal transduction histidine kinase